MSGILPVRGEDEKARRRTRGPFAILVASVLVIALIVVPVTASAAEPPAPGASSLPHAAPSSAGTTDWISAIAEGITALTIIFVIAQLFDARKTVRIERTRGFQERYQSDAFDATSRRMIGCMGVESADDCVAVIEACSNRRDAIELSLPWPDGPRRASVSDVTRTLNFFEEMGAAYSQKQLDDKALIASFSVPIIQVMVKGWWWICWEREGRLAREVVNGVVEEGYVEHQDMALALRKENPSFAADPWLQTNEKIRALCLPTGSGEPVDDPDDELAWRTSRRLSLALSTVIERADVQTAPYGAVSAHLARVSAELEQLPVKVAKGGQKKKKARKPRGWEMFLIPKSIDQPCDENWGRQRREANQIAAALNRFESYASLDLAVARVEEMATADGAPAGSGGIRS